MASTGRRPLRGVSTLSYKRDWRTLHAMGRGLSDRVPRIVDHFEPQFAACDSLYDFARANRPEKPPTDDAAGRMIFRTYGRSSKSYQAAVRLAAIGYGVQSAMVCRSLFEDMVVAHWVRRFPEKAPELFERHRRATLAAFEQALGRYDLLEGAKADIGDEDRMNVGLARDHWTGRSIRRLLKDVEDEWEHEVDRRLIHQAHDLFHNNLLVHHSAVSLGIIAGEQCDGRTPIELGPHKAYVGDALIMAFIAYSNTMSLVLDEDGRDRLARLTLEHFDAFARVTPRKKPKGS
jgi:hypothetical protein